MSLAVGYSTLPSSVVADGVYELLQVLNGQVHDTQSYADDTVGKHECCISASDETARSESL